MGCTCMICKWKSAYVPKRVFHMFPVDAKERKTWLKIIGLANFPIDRCLTQRICSHHFKKSCYIIHGNGRIRLKHGSVPSIHLKEKQVLSTSIGNIKTYKCEQCTRKFRFKSGLQSHLKHEHPVKILKKRLLEKKKPELPLQSPKKPDKMPITGPTSKQNSTVTKNIFQCPAANCGRTFAMYFKAYQHIQNQHCVNKNGDKVSPDSPDLIKPIRISNKNVNVTNIVYHEKDGDNDQEQKDKYLCLGCDQIFDSISFFEIHLRGLHGNDCECYFLSERSDFKIWKLLIENQTKLNYVILKNELYTRVYHCSHQPPTSGSAVTHLCPSAITVKELPHGLLIKFYKSHAGHKCPEFVSPDNFKNQRITSFFRETDDTESMTDADDKDLYVQLRRVINNIAVDAAKLNIATLKILLGKALEMTKILNSYEGDFDVSMVKRMSDDQIAKALEDETMKKRKADTSIVHNKKMRKNENENVINVEHKKDDIPVKFSTQKNVEVTKDVPAKPFDIKMVDAKVSDEQKNNKTADINKEVPVKPDNKKNVDNPKDTRLRSAKLMISPSSFNDSYKNFVHENFKNVDKNVKAPNSANSKTVKKKEIVKTKIGQFKPNLSPKKDVKEKNDNILSPKSKSKDVSDMPKITKVWTMRPTKPDIKYEVKERENDCNILILKI